MVNLDSKQHTPNQSARIPCQMSALEHHALGLGSYHAISGAASQPQCIRQNLPKFAAWDGRDTSPHSPQPHAEAPATRRGKKTTGEANVIDRLGPSDCLVRTAFGKSLVRLSSA